MKIRLRERDRRALILLAAAAALYLMVSQAVLPIVDRLQVAAESAAEKEDQLRRYRRALLRKGRYTQLLDQARKNVAEGEAFLLRGDNPSLASVEFQNLVEEAAKNAGIGLSQRNISAAKKTDDFFNEITMTLSFESTPNQLTTFLSEIKTSAKFIAVRNAQIAPSQVLHAAPKTGEFQKTLRVSLNLAAILAEPPRG
jgi:hypothetical protein